MARSPSKPRSSKAEDAVNGGGPAVPEVTPLRRQYLEVKARHPDAIVLFRLGDFYETFDEDARTAAAELDIVLTGRDMGKGQRVPMAGVPAHSLEGYLARLIRRGYKVAICEQVSEPVAGGGLVDRDVVRVVTPGTVVEPGLLDERANNFIAAVALQGDLAGTGLRRHHDCGVRDGAGAAADAAAGVGAPRPCGAAGPGGAGRREHPRGAEATAGRRWRPRRNANCGCAVPACDGASHAAGALRRHLTGGLRLREPAAGGPCGGRTAGLPAGHAEGQCRADHGAAHLFAGTVHGAGLPNPPEPGAVPGRPLRGRHGAAGRARLHEDAHGRSPAAAVAGAAAPRSRRVGAPAGRRCMVPHEQHQEGEHRGAAWRHERPGAAGEPGDRRQRDAPRGGVAAAQPGGGARHARPAGGGRRRRRLAAGRHAPLRGRRRGHRIRP